ncbi:hypothetical protein HPB50_003582 [Hyalomma asiaticum]|uniref:Uncharacterized protein n=1 Tax=Hyalomma asiaticum TaxID=266040 RepID=A0ACB7SX25_HYAAI|nr:hypothetical protein HPB50_003582 [Hyalomma asiaticum]
MAFNGTALRVAYVEEVDISPGPFIMTSERILVANPSFPWAYENMNIFAAKPLHFTTKVFGFANAFSGSAWMASAATLLLLWLVLAAILSKSFAGKAGAHASRRAVSSSVRNWRWSRCSRRTTEATSLSRCLIAIWLLAVIVMRTSFLGEMNASLVVRTEVTGIQGIEDVAKMDHVTPIVLKGSGFYSYIKGRAVMFMGESAVAALMADRCKKMAPLDAEFYYAPRPVTQMPLAMFTSKWLESALRREIDDMIKIFMERGFIAKFYRDSRLETPPCRSLVEQSHNKGCAGPQLDFLQGVFLTLLVGLSVATTALLAEVLWHRAGRRG